MSVLSGQVVDAIRTVVGSANTPLHEPSIGSKDWLYVKQCLASTFVSSIGKFVNRFEADLVAYTGAKYAVAVVNGTAALHIALKLANVGSDDEVLVPALSFVATANAVTYCGARPHFVDSEESTLGVDPHKLREYLTEHTFRRQGCCINKSTGRVVRALVVMHTFGHPVDLDRIMAVANDFDLTLIEDAAESIGSFYHGKHTGTFGELGTLSFNGNKTITTGGGGAILTNNAELARRARHVTTTAKMPHAWEYRHDEVGYNYRMPNLNAALGCAQLEKLPDYLRAKRRLFKKYKQAFESVTGVSLVSEPEGCRSNYWLQTLLLDKTHIDHRDSILCATNEVGYETRPAWVVMDELDYFRDAPRMELITAKSIAGRVISLPSSPGIDVV